MNQVAASPIRNELPRAIADRLRSQPRQDDAADMLKDIAFVLSLTRRVRAEMFAEHDADA